MTLYLAFDGGITLEYGVDDDAPMGKTYLVPDKTTTPAFMVGAAGRDATIASIVSQVKNTLARWAITVTTTRPDPGSGDYAMIVLGGSSRYLPAQDGLDALFPENSKCTVSRKGVGFVFDGLSAIMTANHVLFGLTRMLSMGWANSQEGEECSGNCASQYVSRWTRPCYFSHAVHGTVNCMPPATYDQFALLDSRVGCR